MRRLWASEIHLDGRPITVVGVLPAWFTYPDAGIQLWVPYQGGCAAGGSCSITTGIRARWSRGCALT